VRQHDDAIRIVLYLSRLWFKQRMWMMNTINIYLNSPPRHPLRSFYCFPGGELMGVVVIPPRSSLTVSKADRMLSIPLMSGDRINLYAADVLEQARVGGCGLKLMKEYR
jgi:hypothetical protein